MLHDLSHECHQAITITFGVQGLWQISLLLKHGPSRGGWGCCIVYESKELYARGDTTTSMD